MQVHAKVSENQNGAPSQTEEGATHQKELPPNSHANTELTPQRGSSGLGSPQQARDLAPNQKDGDGQQSDLSSNTITTNLSESEAQTSDGKAGEVDQPATTPSQGPAQRPDSPAAHSPQLHQDEESGEATVAVTGPPPAEPPQGPSPTSSSPQRTEDEETESANLPPSSSHRDPPEEPSHPDGAKTLQPPPEGAQQPLKEGTPKAEVVRVDTPHPGLPHPQDPARTQQTQDREDPRAEPPRVWLAPTRLPQPRVLAPLQSRRPTPKLLSPSREAASGLSSDPAATPSPRPPPAQEGDPGKLPLLSPPHPKPAQHPSPHAGHSPQEVKLPLLGAAVQELAPQPAPAPPQEEGAQAVRLPRIPTPFGEQQLPQNAGARHEPRSAKEKQAPGVGRSSSKKIPDAQASPQNREPAQQTGARKKKLPIQRETAKGPAHLKKTRPGIHPTALQPESRSRPTRSRVPNRPGPSPPGSRQGDPGRKSLTPESPEPAHNRPVPKDPQSQEEKKEKVQYSRKKTRASLPPDDLVPKVAVSQKGPSLKENSGGLSQENETTVSSDHPIQEGQYPRRRPLPGARASAESALAGSAPRERPRRAEGRKSRRSQRGESASGLPAQGSAGPSQQPVRETSQTGESSVHGDSASRQHTKEKRTRKPGGAPQDRSPAAPQDQDQVSAEEQGSRKGRLRARGSQSTKV